MGTTVDKVAGYWLMFSNALLLVLVLLQLVGFLVTLHAQLSLQEIVIGVSSAAICFGSFLLFCGARSRVSNRRRCFLFTYFMIQLLLFGMFFCMAAAGFTIDAPTKLAEFIHDKCEGDVAPSWSPSWILWCGSSEQVHIMDSMATGNFQTVRIMLVVGAVLFFLNSCAAFLVSSAAPDDGIPAEEARDEKRRPLIERSASPIETRLDEVVVEHDSCCSRVRSKLAKCVRGVQLYRVAALSLCFANTVLEGASGVIVSSGHYPYETSHDRETKSVEAILYTRYHGSCLLGLTMLTAYGLFRCFKDEQSYRVMYTTITVSMITFHGFGFLAKFRAPWHDPSMHNTISARTGWKSVFFMAHVYMVIGWTSYLVGNMVDRKPFFGIAKPLFGIAIFLSVITLGEIIGFPIRNIINFLIGGPNS